MQARKYLSCLLLAAFPLVAQSSVAGTTQAPQKTKKVTAKKSKSKVAKRSSHRKQAVASQASPAATPSVIPAAVASLAVVAVATPAVSAENSDLVIQPSTPPANPARDTAAPAYSGNPYLAYRSQPAQPAATESPYSRPVLPSVPNVEQSVSKLAERSIISLPTVGEFSILPKIKTVYPTGEKPLKVLTFKCPTELVGISTPPIKLMHEGVNLVFDGLNKTDLLPFDLQQVCM